MRVVSACLTAGLILSAAPAFAQTTKPLQKFNDWQVFVHEAKGERVCFAATQPKDMEPKNVRRGSVFLYLTTWQKDGVRNEISVKIGYPLKPNSEPMAIVGSQKFKLFSKGDKAFMRDPADERKLIEAMKKGSILTLKGTSTRGTNTTDQYSLSGVGAAVASLGAACP
jgi:invasion protein IalB